MNVQEILEDADLLMKNSFPISRKVFWLNQVQRQLHLELPKVYSSQPTDIREEQLTFVPRLDPAYHELLSLGIAKRMAEREQDFKTAQELEVRYQQMVMDAAKHLTPKVTKVTIKRAWM